ncbi:head-tail connector protein [Burkholderia gladioli]|uniref:head-tail connector protein n=1 Tax=Burkholderia gladioli TaxID=28095 RepID=UPI00163E6D64|nr:hypothetical protein [Burkholderia gladioli]
MFEPLEYVLRVAGGRVEVLKRPGEEAIDIELARTHREVDEDDKQGIALLTRAIVAAREALEREIGRPLLPQDCRVRIDEFPFETVLLWNDVTEVLEVTYRDVDGARQTLPPAAYRVKAGRYLAPRGVWPAGEDVEIRFRCGAFDVPDAVPESLRSWMLLHIGTQFEQRESRVEGVLTSVGEDFTAGLLTGHHAVSL